MIQRISIDRLQPNMFVHSFELSWFKHPYLTTKIGLVRDQKTIRELLRLGVRHVEIDTALGLAPDGAPAQADRADAVSPPPAAKSAGNGQPPAAAALPPHEDPARTLRFAKKLFSQAMVFCKHLSAAAEQGASLNAPELRGVIGGLITSVNHNENILHTLLTLKSYDVYTYTHSLNLAALGVLMGKAFDHSKEEMEFLGMAGMLHDVGKCLLPKEILNKPGPLTPEEFQAMRSHPLLGFEYVKKQADIPREVLPGILDHHERIDGKGYPRGLSGAAIARDSSLLSIIDIYDALTSDRVYRGRMSPYLALRTLFAMRDQAFPAGLVERFIKCMGIYPASCLVQLKNGCYAVVDMHHPERPMHPVVMLLCNSQGQSLHAKRVDTWRMCKELGSPGYAIERPVEPGEFKFRQAAEAAARPGGAA